MPDLVGLFGIRLQLLIGQNVPLPASYDVMDALASIQVTNKDRESDGFQMEFNLGKDTPLEYSLLANGALDIKNRVTIMVIFGALPETLIDGIITHHQLKSDNEPGRTRLIVTGEDISAKLSFDDQSETHPQQKDSEIVEKILSDAGFDTQITETKDTPNENERTPCQQCNNLKYVRKLAKKNGFVFYVEPSDIPGRNIAYWGPENRQSEHQPPLTVNMGAQTNVDTPIHFGFNAMGPAEPDVSIIDPFTKTSIQIPIPTSVLPSLSSAPAVPLRKVISRDTANLSFVQALLRAVTGVSDSSDAIEATGEVDAVRYGHALKSRRLVDVRGAGSSYDGTYYVREVIHNITRLPRGGYKMQFTLTRDGLGASSTSVGTQES
jgi:hypothetical protein